MNAISGTRHPTLLSYSFSYYFSLWQQPRNLTFLLFKKKKKKQFDLNYKTQNKFSLEDVFDIISSLILFLVTVSLKILSTKREDEVPGVKQ